MNHAQSLSICQVMGENLDFVGVMTYDLHGSWETKTGLHSPLFSATEEEDMLNIAWVWNW